MLLTILEKQNFRNINGTGQAKKKLKYILETMVLVSLSHTKKKQAFDKYYSTIVYYHYQIGGKPDDIMITL
jgi:hypothetical protein